MNTEVDVTNSDYVLVPGMYAEVNLSLRQSAAVLAVPLDAVEKTGDTPHVYAVRDSTIRIIPVVTGLKTAQQEEIRSGLGEGDLGYSGPACRTDRRAKSSIEAGKFRRAGHATPRDSVTNYVPVCD